LKTTNGKVIKPHELDELKCLIISLKKAEITLIENNSAADLHSSESYQSLSPPAKNHWIPLKR
jgi:hypothetical protein